MQVGRLAARAVIGGLFIGHGTQKLFGWFGGPGIEGTQQMMGALEMHPPKVNAYAAGITETAGGALLVAGAATPLAGASLIGTMFTAIRKVHQPKGPWVAEGGWEYNAVLVAALMALIDGGPGDLSVDAAMGRQEWGPGWALAGLGLGAAASAAAMTIGRQVAASAESSDSTASTGAPTVKAVADNAGPEADSTEADAADAAAARPDSLS
jgi:putative oxidoreductase